MVFLGLGILVVSAAFLAYRYPIRRWQQQGGPATVADRVTEAAAQSGKDDDSLLQVADPPPISTIVKGGAGSPSTTPKATAQNGDSQGPIPTFNLDSGTAKDEAIVPKAQPPSMPPPPRPISQFSPKHSSPSAKPMPPPPRPSQSKGTSLMPPPSVRPSSLRPLPRTNGALNPPPSAAAVQRGPPRLSPATSSLSPTSLNPAAASSSTLPPSSRPSKKVLLPPGHSPLDWAHLTRNPPDSTFLRGKDIPSHLVKVSPSMLKERNGRKGKDAWGTWQGRVYNLTPYRDFHPGGVGELMRGAGKVGIAEQLFNEVHPWVNWEGMLGECLIGILVGENEVQILQSKMDEMD